MPSLIRLCLFISVALHLDLPLLWWTNCTTTKQTGDPLWPTFFRWTSFLKETLCGTNERVIASVTGRSTEITEQHQTSSLSFLQLITKKKNTHKCLIHVGVTHNFLTDNYHHYFCVFVMPANWKTYFSLRGHEAKSVAPIIHNFKSEAILSLYVF